MSVHEEITNAISAHGQWKQKLRTAIATGECESTPDKVKMDCNCSFGKWLHERIDPFHKTSPFYPQVVELHAQFHREAGNILELALTGHQEEASNLLSLGSDFAKYSAKLTHVMGDWKSSL